MLTLVLDGSSLSGSWSTERGDHQFANGIVNAGNLVWQVEVEGPMGKMTLRFSGIANGNLMEGEVELGSFGKGVFEANRLEPSTG